MTGFNVLPPDQQKDSYIRGLRHLLWWGYWGQTAVMLGILVKAVLWDMKAFGNTYSNRTPCQYHAISPTIVKPKWKLSFCLSSPSAVASLGCESVPARLPCKCGSRWPTVAVAAGRQSLPPPHVEHHSHRTVVSRGAGESLSSAPTGIKPGAENWDLTVRAMTSCFAHLLLLLLLLILVLIDSMFYDNIALSLSPRAYAQRSHAFGHTPAKVLLGFSYLHALLIPRGLNLTLLP